MAVQWPIVVMLGTYLKECHSVSRAWKGAVEEGCTTGVWFENESILMDLPKVSEVTTNYWIFSKVWLVTWLYLILLPILG